MKKSEHLQILCTIENTRDEKGTKKTGYFIHDNFLEAYLIITQDTKHVLIYLQMHMTLYVKDLSKLLCI